MNVSHKKEVERPEQYKCLWGTFVLQLRRLEVIGIYIIAFFFCCFLFIHGEILILIYFCWMLAIGFLLLGSLCFGTSSFPANWLLFTFH